MATLVVKIGSSNLVGSSGELDLTALATFVTAVAALKNAGHYVVIVTSGAVAAGRPLIDLQAQFSPHQKQIHAAIGQGVLIQTYAARFAEHQLTVGQVLLVREDLDNRQLYLNARETLQGLLAHGVIPIVNENDVVTAGSFGGNDLLAAAISGLVDADQLILLTDVAGVYATFPPAAGEKPLATVRAADIPNWLQQLGKSKAGHHGTGGIATKLEAARLASEFGIPTVIADGRDQGVLARVLAGDVGTRIEPQLTPLEARKRWILFGIQAQGSVTIDHGAANALQKGGGSLLAVGVRSVRGAFHRGDAVQVLSLEGKALAVGLSNFAAAELAQIMGSHSTDVMARFPGRSAEVIHRNNLALTGE